MVGDCLKLMTDEYRLYLGNHGQEANHHKVDRIRNKNSRLTKNPNQHLQGRNEKHHEKRAKTDGRWSFIVWSCRVFFVKRF